MEAVLGIVVFLVVLYLTKELARRFDPKLPPGPWGLPLLGYSPFLSSAPYKDYHELHKKYGPVFGFYFGSRYQVVLGDYPSIKEAYNKDEFLDRPGSFQVFPIANNIISMNGWEWKETRRFVLSTLRTLGMGKNKLEERMKEEISVDMEKLEKLEPNAEVNTNDFFFRSLANNIFSIVNGLNFDESSSVLSMMKDFNDGAFSNIGSYFMAFHFPVLKIVYFFMKMFGLRKEIEATAVDNYLLEEIRKHEKNFDPNNKEDFFDYYIDEMKKNEGKRSSFSKEGMLSNARALIMAATETTQITLNWMFLCLAQYQDAQEKVYQELVELLGKERTPSWEDRDKLPYTYAFIMEVERFKTIAPASDPHWSSKAGTISGVYIPKDSIILANIYAVHMDEKLWGDPQNFRPERFISPDGKLITPEYWMPFLIGKRMCAGEKLAIMQVFLVVTTIVQKFHVVPPKSGISMEERFELMTYAKKPVVSFQRRS